MSYASDRQAWLELEQMKAMAPADDGTCRKCFKPSPAAALCGNCDLYRLTLMRRFGGRAGSDKPRRRFSAPREEWTPYPKDREDRR